MSKFPFASFLLLVGCLFIVACRTSLLAQSPFDVLTYHNNNARTGVNSFETNLTPANVSATGFGKIFSQAVDGYIYAQPLYMANVPVQGKGTHNVVFVATEHDSVFAFDADNDSGPNSAPLWHASFINPAAGISSVPAADIIVNDLVPEVGITGTPVIDPVSSTLYIVAKTKENGAYYQRLHALDIGTGTEKFGGPAVITASFPGTGDGTDGQGHVSFDALHHLNRPGLLLLNGIVYMAFGAHGDRSPSHGWLIGYDAKTLTPMWVYNTTPNGSLGSIWMSGAGPACDDEGSIYFETGNGSFDNSSSPVSLSESVVKLTTNLLAGSLFLADYFTPYNQAALTSLDADLGSCGCMVLPDSVGSTNHPHLLVASGKQNTVYLLDRDHMGQFNSQDDSQVAQSMSRAVGAPWTTPGHGGGIWSMPAYFNNGLYYQGSVDVMRAFAFSGGLLSTQAVSQSSVQFGFPGATPSISANGTNNAIVWAIQTDAYAGQGPAVLHAYNASDLSQELYNSNQQAQRDNPGPAAKFAVPTIANGKVYVGTANSLSVFGLATFLPAPTILPVGSFFTNSISITVSNPVAGAEIHYTVDGTDPSEASLLYTGPILLTASTQIKARAFKAGFLESGIASATFIASSAPEPISPVPTNDLKLWLRADLGVTVDTNLLVTAWADHQSSSASKDGVPVGSPVLAIGSFPNGPHPVIKFNGNSGFNLANGTDMQLTDMAFYIVVSIYSDGVSEIMIANYRDIAGWAVGISDVTMDRVKWFTAPPDSMEPAGAQLTLGNYVMLTATYSSAGGTKNLYVGTNIVGSTTGVSLAYASDVQLTAGYLQGQRQWLQGGIAEILAYSSVSEAQRNQVQAYLNQKYFVNGPVVQPTVTIAPIVNSTVVLSWPAPLTGYGLQVSDGLDPMDVWTWATNAVVITGDQNTVTIPLGNSNRFFRLKR